MRTLLLCAALLACRSPAVVQRPAPETPGAIEHTVLPSEPSLLRLAETSKTFASWLDGIDAVWLVRARCADGDALFVVTAYRKHPDRVFAFVQTRTRSAS